MNFLHRSYRSQLTTATCWLHRHSISKLVHRWFPVIYAGTSYDGQNFICLQFQVFNIFNLFSSTGLQLCIDFIFCQVVLSMLSSFFKIPFGWPVDKNSKVCFDQKCLCRAESPCVNFDSFRVIDEVLECVSSKLDPETNGWTVCLPITAM